MAAKIKKVFFAILFFSFLPYGITANEGSLTRTLKGHTGWVLSVAFSPDGKYLASGSGDGTIKLWRVSDGKLIRTFKGHANKVVSVSFSPDGKLIASGSWDCTIKIWHVSKGSLIRTLKGHTGYVNSVSFSPDGKYLASGSEDKTIKIWRTSDGSLIRTVKGHISPVNSVSFSPDGKYFASGSEDKTIKIWSAFDGFLIGTLIGHTDYVRSLSFSPDGKYIASGSDVLDNTIKIWRVSDDSLIRTLKGHTGKVYSVSFSPDGKFLVSGSQDETIKVWRISNGTLIETLKGHTFKVWSVSFSPDGKYLASGSWRAIKIWLTPWEKEKRDTEEGVVRAIQEASRLMEEQEIKAAHKRNAERKEKEKNEYLNAFNGLYLIGNPRIEIFAGSKENIEIKLNNESSQNFRDITVKCSISQSSPYIEYKSKEKLNELKYGEGKKLIFPVSVQWHAKEDNLHFNFEMTENRYNFFRNFSIPVEIKRREPIFEILDIKIDDSSTAETWGDGDGIIEKGERVKMSVMIVNNGKGAGMSSAFHLLTAHPHIEITKGKEEKDDILPGEKKVTEFVLSLDAGYIGPKVLPLLLKITGDFEEKIIPLKLSYRRIFSENIIIVVLGALLLIFSIVFFIRQKTDKKEIKPVQTKGTISAGIRSQGDVFDKYEIIRERGRGGMGIVYEAMNKKLGKKIALKKMKEELAINPRERERFLMEARRVAVLQHPHIVDIYDIIEEKNNIYLIFEFVEGRTIEWHLNEKGKFILSRTIEITKQICEALDYAHGHKIIHRDMTTSNIMICHNGRVKVMDFGIAREAKNTFSRLTGKDTSGTLAYMAPEQELGSYDVQSDIFSVGVCFYEMLAGELPYKGPNFYLQKTKMSYRKIREINPEIPQEIESIIEKCLQPEKENRYNTVEDLITELKKI
ncbi:MAG: protein kinase [bacterium]